MIVNGTKKELFSCFSSYTVSSYPPATFFKIELSIKYLFILHLIFKFQYAKIEEILIFESYPFVITYRAFRLKVQTFFKNKEQRIYQVEFHL